MFKTYFIDVIKNHYFDFKGKATRKQFWLWILWMILVVILVSLLRMIPDVGNLLGIIILLGLILPNWGIMTRRVRDAGLNPWLVLLAVPNVLVNLSSQFASRIGISLLLFSIIAFICFIALFIIWLLPSKN